MTSSSIVRRATPDDRGEIWRLIDLWEKEQFTFKLSNRKVDYMLSRFLDPATIAADDAGTRGFVGVIGKPEKLEAIIILGLSSWWYSEEVNLDEYVSFVDPECRASNHAKALIGYAKSITNSMIAEYPDFRLIMGILSVKRTAAKVRLVGQQMQTVGAMFTWPPIDGIEAEPIKRLYKGRSC